MLYILYRFAQANNSYSTFIDECIEDNTTVAITDQL